MMATRSVLDTLDLCTSVAVQTDSPTSSQGIGWLSPRISFSTGFVDKTPIFEVERIGSGGKEDQRVAEDRALDFEFCMAASSLDPVCGGCMLPADELFHKGQLRPQSLPPLLPRQEKMSVSFSGPLDTLKTPYVSVALPMQRQYNSGVSKSGPLAREEASFSGPLHRQEKRNPRFSGPFQTQPASLSCSPARTSDEAGTSSAALPGQEGAGRPKSQAWEKVFGLLRRARSDSHRDRLCPERDKSLPPKISPPMQKNTASAANSLRLIFRRNSSMEKSAKANSSESGATQVKCGSNFSPIETPTAWSPLHPAAYFDAPAPALSSKPTGLAALHVASPVYPTSSAFEIDRDVKLDVWSSSATDVDLRPGSVTNTWRMHETESSLEITFDKFDKLNVTDVKKNVDRGPGTSAAATNPTRFVLKNLERCSNPPCKGGKGQDQLRALRTREIRRSPERLASYTSSVRVTPVLNVPVCIAPAMRSSKAAKGRLAGLRSLLSFKKDKDEKSFPGPGMAA